MVSTDKGINGTVSEAVSSAPRRMKRNATAMSSSSSDDDDDEAEATEQPKVLPDEESSAMVARRYRVSIRSDRSLEPGVRTQASRRRWRRPGWRR